MALSPRASGRRRKKSSSPEASGGRARAGRGGSECGDEFGHGGEQVLHEPVVGNAEDRRLLVLVDGDDDLRILHTRKVLDGTADAGRDVELRRHDLASLSDLPIVRRVAGIDSGAARAERLAGRTDWQD